MLPFAAQLPQYLQHALTTGNVVREIFAVLVTRQLSLPRRVPEQGVPVEPFLDEPIVR